MKKVKYCITFEMNEAPTFDKMSWLKAQFDEAIFNSKEELEAEGFFNGSTELHFPVKVNREDWKDVTGSSGTV